jgi:DNA invertase Pin-like site-specific DNA recombinase
MLPSGFTPTHVLEGGKAISSMYARTREAHTKSHARERRGWEVVEIHRDADISGAKGRDQRPGLDAMAWAIDRLGQLRIDLLGTIQHLEAVGVDLYLEQQHRGTTTPTGKLLFHITGAFGEFKRGMIQQRVNAGLAPIKARIARGEKFKSRAAIVRRNLRRPGAKPQKVEQARQELARGMGINKMARLTGLAVGTVVRLKREMVLGN